MAWTNVAAMAVCGLSTVGVAWALAWMVVRVNASKETK